MNEELFTPGEPLNTVPDKTKEELAVEVQQICNELTTVFGLQPVEVELEGSTTRVKMVRVRGGYKILFGIKAFMTPKHKLLKRIIHELVHVYHDSEFVQDTCGRGAYHNEVFGEQIGKWGCVATWNKSYGFAGQIELKQAFVDSFGPVLADNLNEDVLPVGTQIMAKPRSALKRGGLGRAKIFKIVCPVCNEVFFVQKDQIVTEEMYIQQQEALVKPENILD